MKYLKLFESHKEIESLCNQYNIKNYTINSDGNVDVDGDVKLSNNVLTKIPIKFGRVSGSFYCNNNDLTSLENCPESVGGDFDCFNNQLTTLKYSPESVGGDFDCFNNQLTTLKYSPKFVGGYFDCRDNNISSFDGGLGQVEGDFYYSNNPISILIILFKKDFEKFKLSLDYGYLRGTDIVKSRFSEACLEAGIEMP